VIDKRGFALYFSRALIPSGKYDPSTTYYKHLGIYAFTPHFLSTFTHLAQSPLEKAERLEQLRALEHGYSIQTVIVESDSIGVDTKEDIQKLML